MDVREEAQVKAAIEAAVAAFGGIDIVVNNASAIARTPVVDTDMRGFASGTKTATC
jgi:citronellol/citronellal dehydrogenase